MSWCRRLLPVALALSAVCAGGMLVVGADSASPPLSPVPRAHCGPGDHPERGMQGRVSSEDVSSGYTAQPITCNTALVGQAGSTGGFRNYRYVDSAGHVCAFFDTTLLFPTNALFGSTHPTGVAVLDISDPGHPVQTDTLRTPAMASPHESLSLSVERGLLAADLGNPFAYPGFVDLYDVSHDCRHPTLESSLPIGVLGHEGTFSPDGRTFWVSGAGGGTLSAVDVSDPAQPRLLLVQRGIKPHGLNVSDDGNLLYVADLGNDGATPGLTVLDVSQVQQRVRAPRVRTVSHITWPSVSIPQVPLPVTIGGHPYLVEIDEFASDGQSGYPAADVHAQVGAARIIDIADPAHPTVVSNIRLEVNMAQNRAALAHDPGTLSIVQGYAGHYCAVPRRTEPGIVACSFILSGLRVFDIRDPLHPREVAYFNAPVRPKPANPSTQSDYAMSAPAFDPTHDQVWYSDGFTGFWAVRLRGEAATIASGVAASRTSVSAASGPQAVVTSLPDTAASSAVAGMLTGPAALALGMTLRGRRRRTARRSSIRREAP